MKKILLRPHHLICMQGFVGKGYSEDFTKHFGELIDRIKNGEAIIQVTHQLDHVCSHCPERCHGVCGHDEMVLALDRGYEEVLGLKGNEIFTWEALLELIQSHVKIDDFHRICATCSWKQFGYCEKGLKEILG